MEPSVHRTKNTHHVRFHAAQHGFARGMLGAFGPILVLFAVTALTAVALALSGWNTEIMLVIAALSGAMVLGLAVALSFVLVSERRATEQERRRFEDRMAGLLEAAMDAIITVDAAQKVVFFNAAAEKVFQYRRDAVIGRPLHMLLPERFHAEHHRHVEQFGATGVTTRRMGDRTVITGRRADGVEFPIEASISQVGEGSTKLYTVILRDVTERVRGEEALRRSEEQYRAMFSTMIEGFCIIEMIFDASGKPVDYRFLEMNPAFERQTGLHNAKGRLMRDLAPDHEEHWFQIYGKIALTGEPAHFTNEARALNRWYDVSAVRIGDADSRKVAIFFNDISERVHAEQAFARRSARLDAILNSAMDAIITVDERQHIVLFNAAAEAVFGCPRDEAIGAPLSWFIPERHRAAHGEHMRRFGATGETSRRMGSASAIVVGLRRNGEEFPIEASISQIDDANGKLYTVILRDVTERVRGENELRRAQGELRQLAAAANSIREQEKSRIARELHDELGQALTALKMDVNWMKDNAAAGEHALREKLEKMRALLDTTVASTRRISSELRPLLLDDLGLVPAIEWLADNFRAHTAVDCELHIDAGLEIGEPYATAVFRILQESLTNISRHAHASLVEIKIGRIDAEVQLSVRDNGRGFEMTAPRKPDSHGLTGLRERAYMLDGEVQIESAPGRGTLIEVSIPIPAHEETT